MKNLHSSYDRHITLVLNTLQRSTHKPNIPSDRKPKLHQTPRQSNGCLNIGLLKSNKDIDQKLGELRLYRSFISMIGSFLDRSPKKEVLRRADIREFIQHVEICLGLREGKLNTSQLGKVFIRLDTIAPFRDGELTSDLEALDAILQAYGDKLAGEARHI